MNPRLKTHPIRVVMADPESLFRAVVLPLFEDTSDIEVVGELPDGRGVEQLVRDRNADVLLLDLEMPYRDGLEVLKGLQASGLSVRPVVLTDVRDRAKLTLALKIGAKGIVCKQGATHDLMNAIRLVHQGLRWIDPNLQVGGSNGLQVPDSSADVLWLADLGSGYPAAWSLLTVREREVATLVAEGRRYKEVARLLRISEHTLKNHLRSIFEKLEIKTRVQLAVYGVRQRS